MTQPFSLLPQLFYCIETLQLFVFLIVKANMSQFTEHDKKKSHSKSYRIKHTMVKIYDYNLLIKYSHISFIWSTVIKIKSHRKALH